ncbi:E3 SUMO-protein ligase PIAS4-like isoform X3, partial [Leptotrombidium deliense]
MVNPICLAFYLHVANIMEQSNQFLSQPKPQKIWSFIEKKQTSFSSDVVETKWIISLVCPISKTKMKTPYRSLLCNHIQCFDHDVFLTLAKKSKKWKCPFCSRITPAWYLRIDSMLETFIQTTPVTCEKIEINSDGTWTIVDDNQDLDSNSKNSSSTVILLTIRLEAPNDSECLLEYFDNIYCESSSLFRRSMWNHHATESIRTTNHIEGWHNCLNRAVESLNPNIFKLIRELQKQQNDFELDLIAANNGNIVSKKKKYRLMEMKLNSLKEK